MIDSWSAFVVIFDSCEVSCSKTNLHYISMVCSALFQIKNQMSRFFSPSILHIPRFLASISPSVVLHGLTGVTYSTLHPVSEWTDQHTQIDSTIHLYHFLCFFYFIWSVTIYSLCLSTESPPVSEDLLPCKICGRRFFSKVLVSISEWTISWQLAVDVNYLAIQMCANITIKIQCDILN